MNINSIHAPADNSGDTRPILIVPYMWIGDFVRGHTVVRVLKQRWPNRPIDLLATSLCAPLVDYMPGVRSAVVCDLPRSRLAVAKQWALAAQLRSRNYGTALMLPRTWKSAIAPALAGIPERVGFVGEARFGMINNWRWGEKALPRFIDKNAALALPDGAAELVFQVLSERHERGSLIVTTNLPFGEWTKVFPDPRLAKAVVDRLTHRAHIIDTGTESWRFRHSLERRTTKKGA